MLLPYTDFELTICSIHFFGRLCALRDMSEFKLEIKSTQDKLSSGAAAGCVLIGRANPTHFFFRLQMYFPNFIMGLGSHYHGPGYPLS